MKSICRETRDLLAEGGAHALREKPRLLEHLESCDGCFEVLESMNRLDRAFEELGELDASEEVVESLLERSELLVPPPPADSVEPNRGGLRLFLESLVPSGGARRLAVGGALLVLTLALGSRLLLPGQAQVEQSFVVQEPHFRAPADRSSELSEADKQLVDELQALGYLGDSPAGGVVEAGVEAKGDGAGEVPVLEEEIEVVDDLPVLESMSVSSGMVLPSPEEQDAEGDAFFGDLKDTEGPLWVGGEAPISFRGGSPRTESEGLTPERLEEKKEELRARLRQLRADGADGDAVAPAPVMADEADADGYGEGVELRKKAKPLENAPLPEVTSDDGMDPAADAARRFLAERERIEGLRFLPAEGYWRHPYVPGDPVLRHLAASLERRGELEGIDPEGLVLHDAAQVPSQPFDAPESAGLGVYLNADRAAVEGPRRLLVQVTLAASERFGGRRPAMNLAVVVDLREKPEDHQEQLLRALVQSVAESQDLGDRFHLLFVTGGGVVELKPEDLRFGPARLALEDALAGAGQDGDLAGVLGTAIARVTVGDDDTAPLGSSAVLLVGVGSWDGEVGDLAQLAHRAAVGGVTVSAFGLGDWVNPRELEQVALAGQGQLRLPGTSAEVASAVEAELAAAGRAVARAVRLRIRLAPGVQLVDVPGAKRLGARETEKVREAERSIDQRLARNLGLEADRGEDEDGLQMVIPTVYAGDRPVVLLDVVVPGPGPVADVQVRYKDLVRLENGVARAHLELPRGEAVRGPYPLQVFESLLALEVRSAFEGAAEQLEQGDVEGARRTLEALRHLLEGLARAVPGLAKGGDLSADLALCTEYEGVLAAGVGGGEPARYLRDSLRLAALRKVLPRPLPVGGP
jgi:hypothetical protein